MSARHSLPSKPLTHWLEPSRASAPAEILQDFLLQFQSLHTRRNYFADIDSFFCWWNAHDVALNAELNRANEKHILLWLEQFKESSTRARKLASLSSFFKYCERRRLVDQNPCQLLKRPKVERSHATQALDENETQTLLTHLYESAFAVQFDGPHGQRQQQSAHLRFAVIHTLFSVGMRVDELCELRLSDLIFHAPHFKLRFVSKGGEEHQAVVSESCAQVINHYLHTCRGQIETSDFVFSRVQAGKQNVKLSQTAVFKMIRESALAAGLNKCLSPHSARATVATVLHRQGVPLGFIQSLLNHKQITTTAHYVKKANERSESAALKAPVSNWLGTNQKD